MVKAREHLERLLDWTKGQHRSARMIDRSMIGTPNQTEENECFERIMDQVGAIGVQEFVAPGYVRVVFMLNDGKVRDLTDDDLIAYRQIQPISLPNQLH